MSKNNFQEIKKRKSMRLKLTGGALLLISFLAQNFLFDYWQSQSDSFDKAVRDYDFMCHAGTGNEIEYYTANFKDSAEENRLKKHYINNAAKMYARALSSLIFASELPDNKKIQYVKDIFAEGKKVSDFKSYQNFMAFSRQYDGSYDYEGIAKKNLKMDKNKSTWRWIFLGSYIIGSVILLYGIKYE